jgi:hypothetical protein
MENNENSLSYMVSNDNLKQKIYHKFKLIEYPQLSNYNNIVKQLLPNKKLSILIILLETSNNSGHWTALVRKDKTLYYFDSYGKGPDDELKYIDPKVRKQLNEKPYLSELLNKAKQQGYEIIYNNIDLQEHKPNINTCGKHIAAFINAMIDNIDLNSYLKLLKQTKQKTKLSYDEIVNELYQSF